VNYENKAANKQYNHWERKIRWIPGIRKNSAMG
jgi:hypothetical protein